MLRMKQAGVGVLAVVAASLWLAAGRGGLIRLRRGAERSGVRPLPVHGANGAMAELNFTVGPGPIYTTTKGFRGTMSVHPGTGTGGTGGNRSDVLFHGAAAAVAF